MNHVQKLELVGALAAAKSRQDVPAALRLMHRDIVLTSSFGTRAVGLSRNERVLGQFFDAFPDYRVTIEGSADAEGSLVCWGRAQMTMTGTPFGVRPNGARADLPVYLSFAFADDLIAEEDFFFDLSTLCAQSGVSTDAVRCSLFGATA